MGGEDDGVALVAQFKDFAFQQVGIDGVEAREGFVEDEEGRFVEDGDDELHLLLHTLGEFFEFLVPPGHNLKLVEPIREAFFSLGGSEPFEAGQVDGLLAHFHFLVQPTLFGQIANARHVLGRKGMAVEDDFAAVGGCDTIDDADEGGLARTVGAEQSENFSARHLDADIVQSHMVGVALDYMRGGEKIHRGGMIK